MVQKTVLMSNLVVCHSQDWTFNCVATLARAWLHKELAVTDQNGMNGCMMKRCLKMGYGMVNWIRTISTFSGSEFKTKLRRYALTFVWVVVCATNQNILDATDADSGKVLVKVQGKPITKADLDLATRIQQLRPDHRIERDTELLERLIDRQLIRNFLAAQKIQAPADEVEFLIQRAESILKKRGEDPKEFFKRFGITTERLKDELGLPIAWHIYVLKTVPPEQIREYFESHRSELDGTELRVRQIFMKVNSASLETRSETVLATMKKIRMEIVSSQTDFASAAKKYSQAPSRDNGGDIGKIGFHGKVPNVVAKAAFQLKPGEVSEPVVSNLGIHMIQVVEQFPGDLSVEDARPEILERLSQNLWEQTIEQERNKGRIERTQK
ncbi:MAG: hypothetical protein FJ267_03555 [Planctomycetes bacterium]|nr:hypothetical protein [Planctomycetota bacterium]